MFLRCAFKSDAIFDAELLPLFVIFPSVRTLKFSKHGMSSEVVFANFDYTCLRVCLSECSSSNDFRFYCSNWTSLCHINIYVYIYLYLWQLIFVWYHADADAFVFLSVLFWVMTSIDAEHNSTTLQIWDWSFDSLVACKNSWYQYWGWREKVWNDSIRAGRV